MINVEIESIAKKLATFKLNQLPRIGEQVEFHGGIYQVGNIRWNLDDQSATIYVNRLPS